MGRAKAKMFGGPAAYPTRGGLLAVELAYGAMQTQSREDAVKFATLLAEARAGHLVDLPKHRHIIDQIVHHTKRLVRISRGDVRKDEQALTVPISPFQKLNFEQRQAMNTALHNHLSIITGGPGTGKTFTAGAIVNTLKLKTLVTAPTGKAVSHLAQTLSTPVKSGTLHSLLGVKTVLDLYKPVEELDAELILVDECSMIDPPLFARLLASIPTKARLVLMGDANQLPAVEGGSVFADLIASQKIPTAVLTSSMRSDRKEILDLAAAVLRGDRRDIRTLDLGFGSASIETIYHNLYEYVRDRDFTRFRILSTLRKGPLGVDALNRYLFEQLRLARISRGDVRRDERDVSSDFVNREEPHTRKERVMKDGGTDSYPILITRNDPKRGLSNGDTAIVEQEIATFPDGKTLPLRALPLYEYGYCISVHKSQGSEYDHVLLLVPDGSENFGREVLYTAITRARQTIAIAGCPNQITAALAQSALKPSSIGKKLNDSLYSQFQ